MKSTNRKRIVDIERQQAQAALDRYHMLEQIQHKLNLPLPPGADHAVALARLQQAIHADDAPEQLAQFSEWVASLHAAHDNMRKS